MVFQFWFYANGYFKVNNDMDDSDYRFWSEFRTKSNAYAIDDAHIQWLCACKSIHYVG